MDLMTENISGNVQSVDLKVVFQETTFFIKLKYKITIKYLDIKTANYKV